MNIKKIVVLSLFLVAIIGIIAPASAALDCGMKGWGETGKGKIKIYFSIYSDIGDKDINEKNWRSKYAPKKKAEINKVNKAVVTIKGQKPITFKKPAKGWKIDKDGYFNRKAVTVKATYKTLSNDYSFKFYDKKNKLLKVKNKGKSKIYWGE